MKKITMLLVILMMITAVGCAGGETNPAITTDPVIASAPETTGEVTTDPVTETVAETSSAVTESPEESGITVYSESFTSGECYVTLMYPRYGDGEHDLFDVAMRNHAMQKYNGSGMMPEDNAVYEVTACNIKYESEYFVSAVIEVHIINVTAARDSMFAYTVNADPRSGRIYLSEELIGELDLLKSAFADGKFEQRIGVDGLMDEVTPEDITQSWRQDYGVFPDMYFTNGSFGVVAELPRVLGGYAGFEIPYADAGDMMNPVARGLVGLIVTTND